MLTVSLLVYVASMSHDLRWVAMLRCEGTCNVMSALKYGLHQTTHQCKQDDESDVSLGESPHASHDDHMISIRCISYHGE